VIRLTIWLLPLGWMAVILSLSGDTFRDQATASVVRPLLEALLPWASAHMIDGLHWLIRKSAHMTEYGILATLWFGALTRTTRLTRRGATWVAFVVAVAWAAVDELHQATTTTRSGSASDVGIDATGAAVAAFFTGAGWREALRYLTTALLWIAAVGGAAVIAVNVTTGAPSGILWLTVPAAVGVLLWRARAVSAHARQRRGESRSSDAGRACRGARHRTG
jgi:VanZ family protein